MNVRCHVDCRVKNLMTVLCSCQNVDLNRKSRGLTPLQFLHCEADTLLEASENWPSFNSFRRIILSELLQTRQSQVPVALLPSLNGYPHVAFSAASYQNEAAARASRALALTPPPPASSADLLVKPPGNWYEHPLLRIILGYQRARSTLFSSEEWKDTSEQNIPRRQHLYELQVRPWIHALTELADAQTQRLRARTHVAQDFRVRADGELTANGPAATDLNFQFIQSIRNDIAVMIPKLTQMLPHARHWVV
jgi:hypothetical protein